MVLLSTFAKVKNEIKGSTGEDRREWAKMDKTSQEILRTNRFKSHFSVIVDKRSIQGFNKLTELISRESINVLGIRYPLEVKYRKMILAGDIDGVDSLFNTMKIEVKDYSNFFVDNTFFADQDHLNVSGATLFGHELQTLLN